MYKGSQATVKQTWFRAPPRVEEAMVTSGLAQVPCLCRYSDLALATGKVGQPVLLQVGTWVTIRWSHSGQDSEESCHHTAPFQAGDHSAISPGVTWC